MKFSSHHQRRRWAIGTCAGLVGIGCATSMAVVLHTSAAYVGPYMRPLTESGVVLHSSLGGPGINVGNPAPAPESGTGYGAVSPFLPLINPNYVEEEFPIGITTHDCVNVPAILCSPPSLSVDGVVATPSALQSRLLGVARVYGSTVDDPVTVQRAEAETIFTGLLLIEGRQDGSQPSMDQAQAAAQRAYQGYLATVAEGHPWTPPLLPGMTAEQYFALDSTIASYRTSLTIAHERSKILAAGSGSRLTILTSWMRAALLRHQVTIDGAPPAFSLPDALPFDI